MVLKMKYSSRRYISKRRRVTRRRRPAMAIARPRKALSTYGQVNLQRKFWQEYWQPSTATTASFWRLYTFTLSGMPDLSDYVNGFDQYKLRGVKVTFMPRSTAFDGADTTDTTLPGITNNSTTNVHVVNDPYTISTPSGTYTSSNLNTFLSNGKVKTYVGTKPVSVFLRPTIDSTFNGQNTARRTRSPWISCSQTGLQHYGFHVFMQDTNLTGTFAQAFDVFYTYYVSFRNPR